MSKKPVHEIRLGRIRTAIWENETTNGNRHNVTFSRLYRDERGNWGDSASFGRDDLPLLWKVADCVHTWIMQQPYVPAQSTETTPQPNGHSQTSAQPVAAGVEAPF